MGNHKGSQYLTINKRLEAAGIDPKTITDDDLKNLVNLKTITNNMAKPEEKKPDPINNDSDPIAAAINVDKDRDDLKEKDNNEIPPIEFVYIPPVEGEDPDPEPKDPEPEDPKEPEPEPDPFAGWDGAMLLWILEAAGPMIGTPICEKFKKVPPPPEKYAFSEPAKRFMKPGADIYMEKIKHLLKHRADLAFIAALAMQWGFVIMKAPKIEGE